MVLDKENAGSLNPFTRQRSSGEDEDLQMSHTQIGGDGAGRTSSGRQSVDLPELQAKGIEVMIHDKVKIAGKQTSEAKR